MLVNNVVPNKLHQELVDLGIECCVYHKLEDGRYFVGECEIKFTKGTDMGLVQQVIDAHDPTPLPKLPTQAERIHMLENMILMMMEV